MNRAAALVVAAMAATLAACASNKPRQEAPKTQSRAPAARAHADTALPQSERYRQRQDGGPASPPIDVSKIAEPVPKVEPLSRYGNKPRYSVLGKTYTVMSNPRGYVERGVASWYGNKFHGYMTSSFEPYDMYAFSAAHKSLPLPSYARVTNLDNGKSVVVRVNDRGPFHDDRLIDLSYAAAVKIGVWPQGSGRVEVRAIDPSKPDLPPSRTVSAPAPAPAPRVASTRQAATHAGAAVPVVGASSRIYLQLGAFGERDNAERARARAQRAGIDPVGIESVAVAGRTVHRVRVGPLPDIDSAEALTARVERLGLGVPKVAIEQ